MAFAILNGNAMSFRQDGDPDGRPVVFSNSLGTDHRLWSAIMHHLPKGLRLIRYDKRGHGLSDGPPPPYKMGTLVSDLQALMDHLGLADAVVVGLSVGGLIAQGLAAKRPDLVKALVLSNTGARIGNRDMWQTRVDAVKAGGIAAVAPGVLDRWFSKTFRDTPDIGLWRNMLLRTPVEGYLGCCMAIAGTDFITPTSGLRLPAMAIAGSEDGATPPDLVRELAGLIPGCRFELIRGAGHLPCVEAPETYADLLTDFLRQVGHT